MIEPLTDTPTKEHVFLTTFLESSFLAFPVVYLAMSIALSDGVSLIGAAGGVVFFGGVIAVPGLVGVVVALIRAGSTR